MALKLSEENVRRSEFFSEPRQRQPGSLSKSQFLVSSNCAHSTDPEFDARGYPDMKWISTSRLTSPITLELQLSRERRKVEELQSMLFDQCAKHSQESALRPLRSEGPYESLFMRSPVKEQRPLGQQIVEVVDELEHTRKENHFMKKELKDRQDREARMAQELEALREDVSKETQNLLGSTFALRRDVARLEVNQKIEELLDFLRCEFMYVIKSAKEDRDRLILALAKERDRAAQMMSVINSAKNVLPNDSKASLATQIVQLVTSLDSEKIKREKSESKIRDLEEMFQSEKSKLCNLLGSNQLDSAGSLNIQIMNTVFSLESERARREKADQRVRELEELHKLEREKLMSHFDEERNQLAQAAMSRIEYERSKRAMSENRVLELQTAHESLLCKLKKLEEAAKLYEATQSAMEGRIQAAERHAAKASQALAKKAASHENMRTLFLEMIRGPNMSDSYIQGLHRRLDTMYGEGLDQVEQPCHDAGRSQDGADVAYGAWSLTQGIEGDVDNLLDQGECSRRDARRLAIQLRLEALSRHNAV